MLYKIVYKYSVPVYVIYTFYRVVYFFLISVTISSLETYSVAHWTGGHNWHYQVWKHILWHIGQEDTTDIIEFGNIFYGTLDRMTQLTLLLCTAHTPATTTQYLCQCLKCFTILFNQQHSDTSKVKCSVTMLLATANRDLTTVHR